MTKPPLKKSRPDLPHTDENWRSGDIVYDLSGDAALAATGDEEAQKRLETQRLLSLKQKVRESRGDE